MRLELSSALLWGLLSVGCSPAELEVVEASPAAACCPEDVAGSGLAAPEALAEAVQVPDVSLINQDGETVQLYRDLVAGRTVVFSFLFTTCEGVCPPIGANLTELMRLVPADLASQVSFVTISVDPALDKPARLKAWREQLQGGADWTLLTGSKQVVDGALKRLGVFSASKDDHTPFLLIGNDSSGSWLRLHGLTPPAEALKSLKEIALVDPLAELTGGRSAAERYFGNPVLIDQAGDEQRLYRDLIAGKVVVIHPFFGHCTNTCPQMLATAAQMQTWLGKRLGSEARILSISVDPGRDDVESMAAKAEDFEAREGWSFLGGEPEQVHAALAKLGLDCDDPETHKNLFLIGNDRTGLWKKALGLADADEVIEVLKSVLDDR